MVHFLFIHTADRYSRLVDLYRFKRQYWKTTFLYCVSPHYIRILDHTATVSRWRDHSWPPEFRYRHQIVYDRLMYLQIVHKYICPPPPIFVCVFLFLDEKF